MAMSKFKLVNADVKLMIDGQQWGDAQSVQLELRQDRECGNVVLDRDLEFGPIMNGQPGAPVALHFYATATGKLIVTVAIGALRLGDTIHVTQHADNVTRTDINGVLLTKTHAIRQHQLAEGEEHRGRLDLMTWCGLRGTTTKEEWYQSNLVRVDLQLEAGTTVDAVNGRLADQVTCLRCRGAIVPVVKSSMNDPKVIIDLLAALGGATDYKDHRPIFSAAIELIRQGAMKNGHVVMMPGQQKKPALPREEFAEFVHDLIRWAQYGANEGLVEAHLKEKKMVIDQDPAEVLTKFWDATGRVNEFEETAKVVKDMILKGEL